MTNRAFSGGALIADTGLPAGRLEVRPLPRHATDGGSVMTAQPFVYTITDGQLPDGAEIPSPMYARFRVYADGARSPMLEFAGSVSESEDPITLGEIYRSTGPAPDIDPEIIRAGDPVERLDLTNLSIELGEGDVIGPASSVDDRIAVFNGTGGKTLADGGKTIAELVAADTTNASAIATEAASRAAADTALDDRVDTLETTVADHETRIDDLEAAPGGGGSSLDADTYDLDAMPEQYTGTTDAEALQWAVDRLLLTDDGDPTERNITILVPARVVDVTSATVQETGTLGTYGLPGNTYGTRKGANAQVLIPATGNLATKKCLVLTLKAKQPSVMGYSVVNGDGLDVSVPPTTSVIKSDLVGMGNVAMIGASRALDGYAGLYFSLVQLRTEGVTFRATEGITALDASHLFSWQGEAIADTGVSSADIRDPRRKADGTWFVEGVTPDGDECAFEFQQFAFKTPKLWNGGSIDLRYVAGQGYRNLIDLNEHVRLGVCFPLYCFVGVKLMGQSHTSLLDFVKPHRCPYGVEGPEAGGWFGNAPEALTVLRHYGGEGYHPGEFGNPAGDRWFNHRSRFSDPNNLWYGWAEYHPSTAEPPETWPTMPDGEGENVQIRKMLDPLGGSSDIDTTPAMTTHTWAAGVTIVGNGATETEAVQEVVVDDDGDIAFGALQQGQRFTLYLKHSGDGHVIDWAAASGGYNLVLTGSFDTPVDNLLEVIEGRCTWTTSPTTKVIEASVRSLGVVADLTSEGGSETLIFADDFNGAGTAFITGRTPSTPVGAEVWADYGSNGWATVSGSNYVREWNGNQNSINVYDVGQSAGVFEADWVLTGAGFSLGGMVFNGTDFNTHWRIRFRESDGLINLERISGGLIADAYSGSITGGSAMSTGAYLVRIEFDDNSVTVKVNGATVIDESLPSRAGATGTDIGLKGSNGAETTYHVDEVRFYI